MMLAKAIVGLILACCSVVSAQSPGGRELAKRLADPATRERAVAEIAASDTSKTLLLLSWAGKAPDGLDREELNIGLADAFGALRAKAAIPFLLKNISMSRSPTEMTPWIKSEERIRGDLPAANALIQIGPAASRAVIRATWGPLTSEERLAAIFVVSRIKGSSESRVFLKSTLAEINIERYWIEQGLAETAHSEAVR